MVALKRLHAALNCPYSCLSAAWRILALGVSSRVHGASIQARAEASRPGWGWTGSQDAGQT